MPDNTCCVGGEPGVHQIGGRWFCERHYQSALRERRGVWNSNFSLILALVLFVGLVFALDKFIQPVFTPVTLLLTGVVLALVPAGIWLVVFYQQDRLEPEPKSLVLAVFVLGALLAGAVGVPLVEKFFRVSDWLFTDTMTTILGSILVIGFAQEFLKYVAVRYSIYNSLEFDEATDGVIYATAAGLGYATVLNVLFVVRNGGVDLGVGTIHMAIVALAQAGAAGITGYFLGRAKFEHDAIWWMPLGITLAAVVNGLFNWARGAVTRGEVSLAGGASNPWSGLVLAALVAFACLGAVSWLIRRNVRMAMAVK